MGERNMICTSQIADMDVDQQGQDHLPPEPCFYLGNNGHYPHPNMYPMLSTSHNTSNIDLRHFPNSHDSSMFYGNQFNGLQHHNPVTTMDLGTPSSFHNPCMIPPSSSRAFPIYHVPSDQLPSSSHHGVVGVGMNEFGVNHHFMDGVRSSGKRKNAEVAPGNYHQANGSGSSSSSSIGVPPPNTALLQSEEQLETGAGVPDATASMPPEYRMSGMLPITGGRSGRSVRSRSNTLGLQMEPPIMHNTNHLVQGNYMGQSFQPAAWVEQQFGSTNNDGSTQAWNFSPAVPYLNGGSVNGVSSEIASMGGQGYSDTMNSRNSTILSNPPMHHHHHHHFHPSPAMQAMHVHNNYHLQPVIPSFRHPTSSTLQHGTMNHSLDDSDVGSRQPRSFPSNGLRMYRPHRSGVHLTPPASSNRPHLRFLSEDNVAILEIPGFYEVGSSIDRHRDMRLDIDDMSYEELLALGERIGNVVTGLPEETILNHLKTTIYISSDAEDLNQETETCIICQVEYRNQEKIGTLDCGHEYHTDCIKRWLQVKNVCPICKLPAINVEGQNTK